MAEGRVENVMSVELAIQRELAYREKLKVLQLYPDDIMEDLLSLPLPSSSPTLRPGPSLVSGSSTNVVPNSLYQVQASSPSPGVMLTRDQFPTSSQGTSLISSQSQCLVPSPCQPSTSNPRPSPGPLAGPSQIPSPSSIARRTLIPRPTLSGCKRAATSRSLHCPPPQRLRPSHNNYVTVDQDGNFFCKVCEVPCTGAICLKQHLKGHKHKAKLQWLQLNKKNGGGNEEPRHQCEACQIWCTNEDTLQMHLKGQKHQAKLQEFEFGSKNGKERDNPKNGKERENQRPRCELCQIWCMNEGAFQQHLKGKNHIARCYALEEEKRAKRERG